VLEIEESKHFFFEKKKQKTFTFSVVGKLGRVGRSGGAAR
jgi:hypothetical protein